MNLNFVLKLSNSRCSRFNKTRKLSWSQAFRLDKLLQIICEPRKSFTHDIRLYGMTQLDFGTIVVSKMTSIHINKEPKWQK